MAHPKRAGNEDKKRETFLEALGNTGNVSHACKSARVPRRTAYNWREADPEFLAAWDKAQDLGTDALEDEANRRAVEGTLKPVYQRGVKVGAIREFSDTLLIFLLKARRPERFKDRIAGEFTGKGGGPMEHKVTGDDINARLDALTGSFLAAAGRHASGALPDASNGKDVHHDG